MAALDDLVEQYLGQLRRENASPHTLRNYASDLAQFVAYFTPPDGEPPEPGAFEVLSLREWLGHLYQQKLSPISVRRKLAAVRSWFQFMERQGVVQKNVAKLLRTPKAPHTLPRVPTQEQTNALVEGVSKNDLQRRFPERDRAIFELLYGCGLRVSELVGLNLADLDKGEKWMRVRGKGKKERQIPFGKKALESLVAYLQRRAPKLPAEKALFLNASGRRLTDRAVRGIVKFYSRSLSGDSALHPHSLRHAYATHLLSSGADLRSIQELLGHAQLSTTQKYTQVSLTDLMTVYDKAHPKAR